MQAVVEHFVRGVEMGSFQAEAEKPENFEMGVEIESFAAVEVGIEAAAADSEWAVAATENSELGEMGSGSVVALALEGLLLGICLCLQQT
jgi:hypothetical protein